MTALAASDVTYAVVEQSKTEDGFKKLVMTLSFGDGSLTYPTGGVPLAIASLGCPNHVRSLTVLEDTSAVGYYPQYDSSAVTLRLFQGDNDNVADAPLIELITSVAPAASVYKVVVEGY